MIDDMRIKSMAQYVNKRVKLRGTFLRRGDDFYLQRARRTPGRFLKTACLKEIEIHGEKVADHIWIQGCDPLIVAGAEPNTVVELTVLIVPYDKRLEGEDVQMYEKAVITDYCARYPEDVVLPNAPCIKIPEEPKVEKIVYPTPANPYPTTTEPPPPMNPFAFIKQVRSFLMLVNTGLPTPEAASRGHKIVEAVRNLSTELTWEEIDQAIDALV